MSKTCPEYVVINGEFEVKCSLEIIAIGPIIDEITGERLGPWVHANGSRSSWHSCYLRDNRLFDSPLVHISWE